MATEIRDRASAIDTDTPFDRDRLETVVDGCPVRLGDLSRASMAESEAFARRIVEKGDKVYGWTTGFGPLVAHDVARTDTATLQKRLLAHLATGTGPPLPVRDVRALMTARLGTLALGASAARPAVADQLVAALNRGLTPVVPSQGTVGASGDLTPLAHLALVLSGEGEAWIGDDRVPATQALARHGMEPLELQGRDGLALVNGTDAMTGIAALNGGAAQRAQAIAILHAALYTRVMGGTDRAFDDRLGVVRPHPGQMHVHHMLTMMLQDPTGKWSTQEPLQDAYTLRCAPQVLGAVQDQLDAHDRTVDIELRSVTDNPVFLPREDAVLHGGNFQGQHIAFASDTLTNAVIKIAELAERRVARLTDRTLNNGLPPFLTDGTAGLDSGFMGAQVTASALIAEMRTRAIPASVQSVPTNANNQDIVSMGTIAARKASDTLTDCYRILAIEAMALTQAVELRTGSLPVSGQNRPLAAWCHEVRARSPHLSEDRALSAEIETLAAAFRGAAVKPFG